MPGLFVFDGPVCFLTSVHPICQRTRARLSSRLRYVIFARILPPPRLSPGIVINGDASGVSMHNFDKNDAGNADKPHCANA